MTLFLGSTFLCFFVLRSKLQRLKQGWRGSILNSTLQLQAVDDFLLADDFEFESKWWFSTEFTKFMFEQHCSAESGTTRTVCLRVPSVENTDLTFQGHSKSQMKNFSLTDGWLAETEEVTIRQSWGHQVDAGTDFGRDLLTFNFLLVKLN